MTDDEPARRDTADRPTAGRTTAGRVADDETSTDPSTAGQASTDRSGSGHADEAFDRRLEAIAAGHRGDGRAAAQFLVDEDVTVRSAALGALARCGELSAGQVQSALADEASAVRRRAVELAPPEVDLIGMLNDRDASVAEATAAALGERDWDPAPVPELCRVARAHDDPLCRESAIAALGAIAAGLGAIATGSGSSPAAGTNDADAAGTSQSDAADTAELHDAADTAALHDDAGTSDADAAGTAALHDDAGTNDADAAGTAALHDVARGDALDTLLAAMADRPQIRRRALLGLHQFDDDRAVDAVRASLEDRDRQVRAVAGELLGVPVR